MKLLIRTNKNCKFILCLALVDRLGIFAISYRFYTTQKDKYKSFNEVPFIISFNS